MNETEIIDFENLKKKFRYRNNIAAAFVFGSAQNAVVKPGSDIDIAILFDTMPATEEKFNLYADLCDAVASDKPIDMIVLNNAEPILAFEAISGKRISNNNPEKTAEFSSYTSRLYEDTMANIQYQYSLTTSKSQK
ncbi:MAG: nucleotidyltransferase domain-containing protein [Victivallaceae bacterium]|nr:nucleotidyltransferase domain-containing protein [Victivallaceae bacterium]